MVNQYIQKVHGVVTNTGRKLCRRAGIHPSRWIPRVASYWRFLGYIKPRLLPPIEEDYRSERKRFVRGWETCRLKVPVGKRLLAISPHPDDEAIGAGGLLWAHRGQAEIHLVVLTNGENGGRLEHPGNSPLDDKQLLACTRQDELLKTAKALRARSVEFMEFPDGNIPLDAEAVERLRCTVARVKPDVVLLPWFLDNHADHRRANLLFAKCRGDETMLVLGYEIWCLLEPNAVFDISEHLEGKLSLIRNYRSQLRTIDYLHYAEGLAHVRGYHSAVHPCRTGLAEAFIALPSHDYCDFVNALLHESEAG